MFFNLGELDDALHYALHAGSLFDVSEKSEYVQTILGEFAANVRSKQHMTIPSSQANASSVQQMSDESLLLQPGASTCTSSSGWLQPRGRQMRRPSMTGSLPSSSACSRGVTSVVSSQCAEASICALTLAP